MLLASEAFKDLFSETGENNEITDNIFEDTEETDADEG